VKVLVTDGANRVALAVVRALGRTGVEVAVVEQERFALKTPASFRSRFTSRHDVIPTLGDDGAFIDALVDRSAGYDVLLPVSTNVALKVAAHRDRFKARVPIPPLMTLRRANDKSAVARHRAESRRADSRDLRARRRRGTGRGRRTGAQAGGREAARRCGHGPGTRSTLCDRTQFRGTARRLPPTPRAEKRFPLIQEKVEGPGYGVGVLAEEGRVLASFAHRRIREYPVTGGPSTICVSVDDPRLTGYAASVIRELGWTGVAMVEFKKDDDYRLMEVNPRFWGSLPLATRSGVNFPALLCRRAMGEDIGAPPRYDADIRLRFLPLDAAAAWSALRNPEVRWSYSMGFLRDLLDPRIVDGILDPEDLEASLVYLANHLP